MIDRTLLALAFPVLLAACAAPPGGAGALESGPPPPFTAEQIRSANPPGTTRCLRFEHEGGAVELRSIAFLADDGTTTVMETSLLAPDGTRLGAPERGSATWEELRDHAAFPPDKTTRRPAVIRTATGRHECWLYEVEDPSAGTTSRFWFARNRPGPPVRMEVEQDGRMVARMEQVPGPAR